MGLYFVGVINRRRRFQTQHGRYEAGATQGSISVLQLNSKAYF